MQSQKKEKFSDILTTKSRSRSQSTTTIQTRTVVETETKSKQISKLIYNIKSKLKLIKIIKSKKLNRIFHLERKTSILMEIAAFVDIKKL